MSWVALPTSIRGVFVHICKMENLFVTISDIHENPRLRFYDSDGAFIDEIKDPLKWDMPWLKGSRIIVHDLMFAPEFITLLDVAAQIVDIRVISQMIYGRTVNKRNRISPEIEITRLNHLFTAAGDRQILNTLIERWLQVKKSPLFEEEFKRYVEVEEPLNRSILKNYLQPIFSKKNLRKALKALPELQLEKRGNEDISLIFDGFNYKNFSYEKKFVFYKNALETLLENDKPCADVFGTVTGRVMLRNPAIQFLSRDIRKIMIGPQDNIFEVDYKSFEPFILAGLSGDKKLESEIRNGDIYKYISSEIFKSKDRELGKLVFLSVNYGISYNQLSKLLNKTNIKISKKSYSQLSEMFPKSASWKKDVFFKAKKEGVLRTGFGNHRRASDLYSEHISANHYLQSIGSYIFKRSLNKLSSLGSSKLKLILPLHDGAIFKVKSMEERSQIVNSFESSFKDVIGTDPILSYK